MGDNIRVKPSADESEAVSVATDLVASVHYPIYKIGVSIEGAPPVHVSATNPLPMYALVQDTDPDGSLVYKPASTGNPMQVSGNRLEGLLSEILKELKLHNALWADLHGGGLITGKGELQ